MNLTIEIVLVIITYIWASIPYGYLLTKRYTGKNILEWGSGAVGATNVRRVAGKKLSIITQNLDILKGFVPVALFCGCIITIPKFPGILSIFLRLLPLWVITSVFLYGSKAVKELLPLSELPF